MANPRAHPLIYQLHHLLCGSALKFPDQTAVASKAGRITYAELDRAAGQLARVLTDSGARKGDRIGIYLKKCVESVVSIFGILTHDSRQIKQATQIARCRRVNRLGHIVQLSPVFLEHVAVENVLRSCKATASSDTVVLAIEADDFFDLLSDNIEIVKALFRDVTSESSDGKGPSG